MRASRYTKPEVPDALQSPAAIPLRRFVRTVSKPGTYADGNGLNLNVVSSGARWWVQRVTVADKRHNIEARELKPGNWPPRTKG